MQTGLVTSWSGNPLEQGPLYPFVGSEMILVVICVALWVAFTLWQLKFETDSYGKEEQALAEGDRSGAAVEGGHTP